VIESEGSSDEGPRPSSAPSGGRTIALAALSDGQRAELGKSLGPGGPAIVRSPDRFAARERLAIVALPFSIVGVAALGLGSFADACWPTQSWIWAAVYAVVAMPLGYLLARVVLGALVARRMPFAPGVYVTSEDVIIAHASVASAIRVLPTSAIAAVGSPRRLPLSAYAEITLFLEGEPAETLWVPALEAETCVGALERAREAGSTVASPERARDARRRDPLGELKRSQLWERSSAAPARSDLPRAILVGALLAIAIGALALVGRNALSDRVAVGAAIAANDVEALSCYVENGGVHAEHVRANALPHAAYERARASADLEALGDYVTAYPDGPDTARARTDWIAAEYAAARDDAWRLRAFVARFPDAPQITEARARLPRLALDAAIAADDVGSLAYVMREHPGTPEAAEAARLRSARYEAILATLVARGGRPEAIAFFRALFAYLSAHETHDVLVRFRTPSNDALRDFDRIASELAGREIEPVSPSFSRRLSEQREALVFDRLRTAFAEVAPRDVLPVVRGIQLPDRLSDEIRERLLADVPEEERAARAEELTRAEEAETGEPEIRIEYRVEADGRIFTSEPDAAVDRALGDPGLADVLARMGIRRPEQLLERDDRAFAGFRILYDIEMRVPDAPDRARFAIEVAPPPSFTIEGGEGPASDGTIYEAMASEAFARLGTELTRAFFGADEEPAPDSAVPVARDE